eukprot:4284714-Amphidinium_carterae.1
MSCKGRGKSATRIELQPEKTLICVYLHSISGSQETSKTTVDVVSHFRCDTTKTCTRTFSMDCLMVIAPQIRSIQGMSRYTTPQ